MVEKDILSCKWLRWKDIVLDSENVATSVCILYSTVYERHDLIVSGKHSQGSTLSHQPRIRISYQHTSPENSDRLYLPVSGCSVCLLPLDRHFSHKSPQRPGITQGHSYSKMFQVSVMQTEHVSW